MIRRRQHGELGKFIFNEPYTGKEIEKINDVILAQQYINFMKKHNGGEGDIGETWLVLFRLDDLQEINDDYCIEEFLLYLAYLPLLQQNLD